LNPFHVDLLNTDEPPEYVCFLCVRPDPAGGGGTILSNLHTAIKHLPPEAINILQKLIFREGDFFDLSGVGSELNPFPVLGFTQDRFPRIRFSGKTVLCDIYGKEGTEALRLLYDALDNDREVLTLQSGQLLIANQLIIAHGRLPLGPQEIPPPERRLILQMFLRRVI
ncbi:MAG: TauD/TfdA family dioxygenase, partial [Blastocatellia bacterium]